MGMKYRLLIDKIHPTYIALTTTAIYHCRSAGNTEKLRGLKNFDPRGGAQNKCDITIISLMVNSICNDVFCHRDTDFYSFSGEI